MQDADFPRFSDPEVEGPFATAASRDTADAYIQGRIKNYEKIIHYCNQRRNALTITCRMPAEILSSIFSQVVQCVKSSAKYHYDFQDVNPISWIRSVSHVCARWREVALATPNLWTEISIDNPSWAQEMVRRSKTVPLIITYQRFFDYASAKSRRRSCTVLTEILRSNLSRLECLALDLRRASLIGIASFDHLTTAIDREFTDILISLNQPAPLIKRFEVRLLQGSKENSLPNELFTMPSRLQHLILERCGMKWDLKLVDFSNLRSLELLHLPEQMTPSMTQLLAILQQTSRLESLNLTDNHQSIGLDDSYPLQDTGPINLEHLKQITVLGDLSDCALFNHIIFSKNAHSIHLSIQNRQNIPASLTQALAEKVDDGIEGSILMLHFRVSSIRCWKFKDIIDMTHITSFCDLSAFSVGFSGTGTGSETFPVKAGYFWRTLRLDQLISLEVETLLDQDSWTFLGDLPRLQDLQVWYESKFLKVLNCGLVDNSKVDAPPVCPTFAALRNLTMYECTLNRPVNIEFEEDFTVPLISIMEMMLSCFELRKEAGLPLGSLIIAGCHGVHRDQVECLRDIIEQVVWNDGDRDSDQDSNPGPGYD